MLSTGSGQDSNELFMLKKPREWKRAKICYFDQEALILQEFIIDNQVEIVTAEIQDKHLATKKVIQKH